MRAFTRHMAAAIVGGIICAGTAGAQTVDEIVARHYESKGGREHWQSIRTQRLTGTVYAQGIEIAMVFLSKRPNLGRQELTLDIPGQGPMGIVNVFDGTKAWTINPMLGPAAQEVTGPEAAAMREQSQFDTPLLDYRDRGHSIRLAGTEDIDGRRAHHLEIARSNEPTVHFYVDAETGAELRIETEGPVPSVVDLSDHRTVDGVIVPHRIRVRQGATPAAEVVLTSVEFNVPIGEDAFVLK